MQANQSKKAQTRANLDQALTGVGRRAFIDSVQAVIDNSPIDRNTDAQRLLFVGRGWQLTKLGFSLLSGVYQHTVIVLDERPQWTGNILLGLDRAIAGPWMLDGKKLHVFDPTVAFNLEICGRDINQYIEFQAPKNPL